MKKKILTAGAAFSAAALLAGCGVLGGGGPRPQMYRFGLAEVGAPTVPATAVQLNGMEFQRAAEGDRMLAINGAEAFYIAQARWVSPARELFAQSASRAFERAGINLIPRGQPLTPVANLNLIVPVFEARYLNGLEAAPTVHVEIEASLAGTGGERTPLGVTRAIASVPAADNTVPSIVAAYEAASRQALDQVAAWAASSAPPASTA